MIVNDQRVFFKLWRLCSRHRTFFLFMLTTYPAHYHHASRFSKMQYNLPHHIPISIRIYRHHRLSIIVSATNHFHASLYLTQRNCVSTVCIDHVIILCLNLVPRQQLCFAPPTSHGFGDLTTCPLLALDIANFCCRLLVV